MNKIYWNIFFLSVFDITQPCMINAKSQHNFLIKILFIRCIQNDVKRFIENFNIFKNTDQIQ